jgi:hypothetical protein
LREITPDKTETPPASPPAKGRLSRLGNFRSSAAQFLGALVLMLVAAPFLDELKYGEAIDAGLMTLVLIAGVLAVGRTHRTLVLAVVLALPAVATRWIGHLQPHLLPLASIASLIFIGFVEFQLLHFIFRARRVNSDVLCAGISGYLLLGILFMLAFRFVSLLNPVDPAHPAIQPGAFSFNLAGATAHDLSRFEAYYFSFITLSTVGYGDISPLSNAARTLAMTEAMTGTLYMAVLISRLVALYSSESQAAHSDGKSGS